MLLSPRCGWFSSWRVPGLTPGSSFLRRFAAFHVEGAAASIRSRSSRPIRKHSSLRDLGQRQQLPGTAAPGYWQASLRDSAVLGWRSTIETRRHGDKQDAFVGWLRRRTRCEAESVFGECRPRGTRHPLPRSQQPSKPARSIRSLNNTSGKAWLTVWDKEGYFLNLSCHFRAGNSHRLLPPRERFQRELSEHLCPRGVRLDM